MKGNLPLPPWIAYHFTRKLKPIGYTQLISKRMHTCFNQISEFLEHHNFPFFISKINEHIAPFVCTSSALRNFGCNSFADNIDMIITATTMDQLGVPVSMTYLCLRGKERNLKTDWLKLLPSRGWRSDCILFGVKSTPYSTPTSYIQNVNIGGFVESLVVEFCRRIDHANYRQPDDDLQTSEGCSMGLAATQLTNLICIQVILSASCARCGSVVYFAEGPPQQI